MVVDDIEMIVPAKGKKRTYNYWFPPTQQYLSSGELRKHFGMSLQDWFDTYVLKIVNIEDRPKCKVCGKPAKWSSVCNGGYLNFCGNKQCYNELDRQRSIAMWQRFSDDKKKELGEKISAGIKRQIASLTPEERHQRFHVNNSIGQQKPETKRKKSEAMLRFWSQFTEEDKKTLKRLSGLRDPESHRKSAEARLNNLANDQTARIKNVDSIVSKGIKTRLYLGKDIEFATNEQPWFTVQSNYELQFIKLLEELRINYEYSPCAVRYFSESQQRNRTYTPDFCVFYKNFIVFVEIKSWFKRNATDVIEKFEALERWTQEQDNCICTMMYEGEVYGTAEHLKYVLDDIVAGKWLPAKPGEIAC